MKAVLTVLLVLLVGFVGVANVGCDSRSQYVGTYVGVGELVSWLELRADGTWRNLILEYGKWEVDGNQLTLTRADGSGVERHIIEAGMIMLETGEVVLVKAEDS